MLASLTKQFGNLRELIRRHPRLALTALFLVVWSITSYIFFLRCPNNFTSPNFYAEDGKDFLANILRQGPIQALFNPFNGYFIVGIYLIGDVARLLNHLFWDGAYIELPRSIALASYLFLGFCAALPVITLSKILRPMCLGLVVLALSFTPMPGNDYVVIGTLGNLKFAFGFIAVLLLAKRWSLSRHSQLIPLLDLGILICAYTTASVYLLVPFYLLCDGLRPRQLFSQQAWRKTNLSLWSALGLGLLMLLQLVYVATHGIPKLPGYLDSPFQYSEAIEIFLGRSVLFGFAPGLYRYFNDLIVVTASIILVAGLLLAARRRGLALAFASLYSAVLASVLFLINRPGLSGLFQHYGWSGPDQFFYAQTMLSIVAGVVLLQAVLTHYVRSWIRFAVLVVAVILVSKSLPSVSSYGKDKSMENARGTVYAAAKTACKTTSGDELKVNIYPTAPWQVIAKRAEVCTPALFAHKTYHMEDLGLTVQANNPVNIVSQRFTQPLAAADAQGNLAGVSLFLSTYQRKISSTYAFTLYQADCQTVIRRTTVKGRDAQDNGFLPVRFTPVAGTGSYCFTLAPTSPQPEPLAVQLSSTNTQAIPPATVNDQPAAAPVTYSLIFEDK